MSSDLFKISRCINHYHVFTGKQGKTTQENFSSSAARMKCLSSGSGVAKIQSSLFYVILSRLSSKALLEFKYRHVVGLVGLCNRILHTTVYRLLLFYIGNAMCIFNCPEGSGIPRYIIACVTEYSYDCFHAVWESIYFCFAKHFPGSIQTVVRTVYTV